MVLELYKAQLEGENPVTGVDGKLAKVFVMGKGDGWGQDVPEPLRSGAWVFQPMGRMANLWPRTSPHAGSAMRRLRSRTSCIATMNIPMPARGCECRRFSPLVSKTTFCAMKNKTAAVSHF